MAGVQILRKKNDWMYVSTSCVEMTLYNTSRPTTKATGCEILTCGILLCCILAGVIQNKFWVIITSMFQ